MELRQLQYFVTVAEELHFRGAAQRLHITQPALSEQIRRLEAELGVNLFNREPRAVTLTPAGSGLLTDARRILSASAFAAAAARATRRGAHHRLRIGHTAFGLPAAMPSALSRMRASGEPVNLEIASGGARSLLADLRAGHLDAAFVHLPGPTDGLCVTPVGVTSAVVAVPRQSCLASGRLTLTDLRLGSLTLMPRTVDPAFHDAVLSSLVQARLFADVIESHAASIDHLLLEITAAGGAAIVPDTIVDGSRHPEIEFRTLPEPVASTQFALVSDPEAQPAALAALMGELERSAATGEALVGLPALAGA